MKTTEEVIEAMERDMSLDSDNHTIRMAHLIVAINQLTDAIKKQSKQPIKQKVK